MEDIVGDVCRKKLISRQMGCRVTPHVFGEMVTAHEVPLTNLTLVLLLTSVGSEVTGQLIGSRKLFITMLPLARKWLLTCKKKIELEIKI